MSTSQDQKDTLAAFAKRALSNLKLLEVTLARLTHTKVLTSLTNNAEEKKEKMIDFCLKKRRRYIMPNLEMVQSSIGTNSTE